MKAVEEQTMCTVEKNNALKLQLKGLEKMSEHMSRQKSLSK